MVAVDDDNGNDNKQWLNERKKTKINFKIHNETKTNKHEEFFSSLFEELRNRNSFF